MIVATEPVYELRKVDLPLPRMTLLPLLSGELQEASAELKWHHSLGVPLGQVIILDAFHHAKDSSLSN